MIQVLFYCSAKTKLLYMSAVRTFDKCMGIDHFYKLLFPLPKETPHEIWHCFDQAVSEKKMFENNCHIHVYSPRAGADNPLGSNCFH